MQSITVTAKIQISVSVVDKPMLDSTLTAYCNACNYVSGYVFETHDLKQFSLNKVLYAALRERFGLKSQMAQSVFKTVIARYKTILVFPDINQDSYKYLYIEISDMEKITVLMQNSAVYESETGGESVNVDYSIARIGEAAFDTELFVELVNAASGKKLQRRSVKNFFKLHQISILLKGNCKES